MRTYICCEECGSEPVAFSPCMDCQNIKSVADLRTQLAAEKARADAAEAKLSEAAALNGSLREALEELRHSVEHTEFCDVREESKTSCGCGATQRLVAARVALSAAPVTDPRAEAAHTNAPDYCPACLAAHNRSKP